MSDDAQKQQEREAFIQTRIDQTLHRRLLREIQQFIRDIDAEDSLHRKAVYSISIAFLLASGIIALFIYLMMG